MKRVLVIFLVVGLLILAAGCNVGESYNTKTPEALGKLVFKSLQDNDYNLFEKAVFQEEHFSEMFEMLEIEDKEEQEGIKKEYKSDYLPGIKESWEQVIQEAKKHNIDLSNSEYVQVNFEIRNEEKYKEADMEVVFNHKGDKYVIILDDCIKLKDGWIIMDHIDIDD